MKLSNTTTLLWFYVLLAFSTETLYAQKDRIPVMASHAIRDGHNTLSNYKNIEEAGFLLAKEYYPSADVAIEHLKTAEKTKIRLIIWCPELNTELERTIERFKGFKSFAGYELSDEPKASNFDELGEKVRLIERLDNNHITWLNLHPYFASPEELQSDNYEDYVQQFIDKVKPPFVSFDCYALRKKGLHPEYYHNLEIIAEKSKKAGIPFWAYVLTSSFSDFVNPTKGTLSFQAFTNLAYGAQGLAFFSYRRIIQPGLNITVSPIDTNYQRMPIYETVKQLNAEIKYYSRYFYNNDIFDVSHLGDDAPPGTHKTGELPGRINVLEYGKKGFVVSHFINKNSEYLMFVNKDYENDQVLKINSPKRIKRLSYYRKERECGSGEFTFTVQPGSMVLLRL